MKLLEITREIKFGLVLNFYLSARLNTSNTFSPKLLFCIKKAPKITEAALKTWLTAIGWYSGKKVEKLG